MKQMNLEPQENSRERYVTFSLCEAPLAEVCFKMAGRMALLAVAQLSTMDGGPRVSWSTLEKLFLL